MSIAQVSLSWPSIGFIALALAVGGCRPDPGTPDYSSHIGLRDPPAPEAEALLGPNPFSAQIPRLYLGAFYEGQSTNEILINDVDTHYFIFENSYSQEVSPERIEGRVSDLLILNGTPFWGGGLIWDTARDLSRWNTMYISFRSESESFADFPIIVQSEAGGEVRDASVLASDYGYANDGSWYNLRIPLSDFQGFDLALVRSPLILSAPGGNGGDSMWIDDFYFTRE